MTILTVLAYFMLASCLGCGGPVLGGVGAGMSAGFREGSSRGHSLLLSCSVLDDTAPWQRWAVTPAVTLRALRGGGIEEGGDDGVGGFATLDLNGADPNMPFDGGDTAPWLKDAEESDEERELVAGMRQKMVLGQDKWYDDTMAAVPRS